MKSKINKLYLFGKSIESSLKMVNWFLLDVLL